MLFLKFFYDLNIEKNEKGDTKRNKSVDYHIVTVGWMYIPINLLY